MPPSNILPVAICTANELDIFLLWGVPYALDVTRYFAADVGAWARFWCGGELSPPAIGGRGGGAAGQLVAGASQLVTARSLLELSPGLLRRQRRPAVVVPLELLHGNGLEFFPSPPSHF